MTFDVAKYLAADAAGRESARGIMRSFVESARDQYATALLCEAGALARELVPDAYALVFHVCEIDVKTISVDVVAILSQATSDPFAEFADDLAPIEDFIRGGARVVRERQRFGTYTLHIDSAMVSHGRPDEPTP